MKKKLLNPMLVKALPPTRSRRRHVNSFIAIALILSKVAEYYHWTDFYLFNEHVKWILEFVALFL